MGLGTANRRVLALLLASQLAPCADNPYLHATFYLGNAGQGTVETALDSAAVAPAATRLAEDGRPGNAPASSKQFRASPYGVTAILAIDTSGSVKGAPLDSVRTALKEFVSGARPQDRIAIVSFADSVDIRQGFTADKTQLIQAIDALRVGSRETLLNAAIGRGLSMLAAETSNARKHLLVITDGKNEGPGPSPAELSDTARKLGIPVDCIGVTRLAVKYLEPMQALALASGGAYIRAKGYEQLRQAMRQGIDGLLNSPVLTFRLARVRSDGASHTFQVTVPGTATDLVSMVLPAPPGSDAVLYASIGAAIALFGIGVTFLLHSRKKQPAPVETPVPVPPVVADDQPRKARVATVYERNEVPGSSPPDRPAKAPMPKKPVPPAQASVPRAAGPVAAPVVKPTEFRYIFEAPAPGQPTAWLRMSGHPEQVSYPIDHSEIWIGTAEANRICVRWDAAVSRVHACIQWQGGDLYLLDNRSTNGTVVNGRRVDAGTRIRLHLGDQIVVGQTLFSVQAGSTPD